MRKELEKFAELCEARLAREDEERGASGWRSETPSWLLDRLKEEVSELHSAFQEVDPESVIAECTDVANFAMMIADVISHKREFMGKNRTT